jgi:hypothetical protein
MHNPHHTVLQVASVIIFSLTFFFLGYTYQEYKMGVASWVWLPTVVLVGIASYILSLFFVILYTILRD